MRLIVKTHGNNGFAIDRNDALECKPFRLPLVRREEKGKKLLLTVELERPRWQRMLGAERFCQRTFALDEYGRQIYEMCNGKNSAADMIATFSKRHNLNVSEAEISVATYMKTLIGKGLLAMEMDRPEKEDSRP